MKTLIAATALILASASSVFALDRFDVVVINQASSGIKHIFARDVEENKSLGDVLVGRIPSYTKATVNVGDTGNCQFRLIAELYDGRRAEKTFNVCRVATWTITDSGELDD